jgi:alpha,alpha-trehalose phosphorylase
VVAAEVGQPDLAYDYWRETALVDLHDVAGNTDDGLHMAALSGAWLVAVAGFGGMRDHENGLEFAPTLPDALSRITFRLMHQGRRLKVEIRPGEARYELVSGEPFSIVHDGRPVTLEEDTPVTLPWSDRTTEHRVSPPKGREALRRGVGADLDAPVSSPSTPARMRV